MLVVDSVTKIYRNTKAVVDFSLRLADGEALGIVGHNGAGKSTLMKVVAGLVVPDAGTVEADGVVLPPGSGVGAAKQAGIRLASQEVVLCPDLPVLENVALAHAELFSASRHWRREAARRFEAQLEAVFPGRRISAYRRTGALSLTELQIVQLTVATMPTSVPMRTLVLDEPTSALTSDLASALFDYVDKLRRKSGVGVVIISHKMADIISNSERVIVMRDGKLAAELQSSLTNDDEIVAAMGGLTALPAAGRAVTAGRQDRGRRPAPGTSPEALLSRSSAGRTGELEFTVFPGEIVGLAGLEGQGQVELLSEIWRFSQRSSALWRGRRRWRSSRRFSAAYVSGDRQQFGLLPLWEVRRNITVASLPSVRSLGLLRGGRERSVAADWVKRVQIREGTERSVLELSGGTQQKVLLARGMATKSDVLLLDDPFRGVDVMTKDAAYAWIRAEADNGKAVVWYSSETAEFQNCDRAYVMRDGAVRASLTGAEISDDSLIRHSFETQDGQPGPSPDPPSADGRTPADG